MKVIISNINVFPFQSPSGISKFPYYLARNLAQKGIDVEVVTSIDEGGPRQEVRDGVKFTLISPMYYRRRFGAPYRALFSLNLARYLHQQDFDIFHAFTEIAYPYLLSKNRKPSVFQPFGMEPFFDSPYQKIQLKSRLKNIYHNVLIKHPWRYCITRADAVASEGAFQDKQIIDIFGVPEGKLFHIAMPIDIKVINEKLLAEGKSRSELGLGDDDFVIITVNIYHPNKELELLLDAFRIVQAQAKNARLIFIGGASRPLHQSVYDGLIRRAVEYGLGNRVICLQNVPEDLLYDYYRLSDVYVSSTSQQDWIMSIAEAMVCGLPIVSRGQEFMVYEGVNGLVVPPPDAKIMAEAILKLYNDKDKRQAMGNESKKIVQQYDWDKVAGEIVKKYESLLGSG